MDADEADAGWLTETLRAAGALPSGAVIAVERSVVPGVFNSRLERLAVSYDADAPSSAPRSLVLKRSLDVAWAVEAGAEEVRFYTTIATLPDHPDVTVPCYSAGLGPAAGRSYLLLVDMTDTHAPPLTRAQQVSLMDNVPPPERVEQVVDCLARLHAYWWEHPFSHDGPFDVGYWMRDAARVDAYVQRRAASWRRVLAGPADWLPADVRALCQATLDGLPGYWQRHLRERYASRAGLTLTHGDAYFANFLCPRGPEAGPTYLVDWQSPGFDLGALDLVNLCATFWTPEQRHDEGRELGVLDRYHERLCRYGVRGYSRADLAIDYRHALIYWLLVPVQDAADGSAPAYWWPKLRCLVAAFRDHAGEVLLDATAH